MRNTLLAICVASAMGLSGGTAHATLIGGPVAPVNGSFGGSTVYNYVGASTPAFTLPGSGTLTLESSFFHDTFGTSRTNQTGQTTIFSNSSVIGTTVAINPGFTPFLLFFHTDGNYSGSCSTSSGEDCAVTLFSDGSRDLSNPAGGNDAGQANLAVYYAASTNTYALFFDDGGPTGCVNGGGNAVDCSSRSAQALADDNDYNDLAITYKPTPTPEPFSLSLLGTALVGLGLTRKWRSKASQQV